MNKKFALFLILSAILVSSFLCSYLWRKPPGGDKEDALAYAQGLFDKAAGDQAKLAQASDILRSELSKNSGNLNALFLQGLALQQRGMIDTALESYRKYLKEKTSIDFAVNFNAGELSELKGDLQNAEKYFIASINSAPQEGRAWERLIQLLLKQNRNQDAKAYFNALTQQLPASDAVKRLTPVMPQ